MATPSPPWRLLRGALILSVTASSRPAGMDSESGDDYLRRIASFIRTNEARLAEAGFTRRRRVKQPSDTGVASNLFSWFGTENATNASATRPKPLTFTIDTHRLFYILMRLEALGFDVGSLDVKVDSPSRPMNYIDLFPNADKSETMSLSSIRTSLSAVSRLSLGGPWWGRPEQASIDEELKYIFSSFTKIPSLCLQAPGPKKISELANDPPNENAIPLDAFKNLQTLECSDVDPRAILGWDRLSDGLFSLTIKRSGVDDVSDIFIGAVLDDQARRVGDAASRRNRNIRTVSRQSSFHSSQIPESITEEAEDLTPTEQDFSPSPSDATGSQLPPSKWASLRHLSLSDNSLTFLPTTPLSSFISLTFLDLSSNLLVSVPPGLSALYSLTSLNLSDNMIDSVMGIYKQLGQVLALNISRNRLESICGLERLMGLERVDVRHNLLEECSEIGRLSTLPNISEVWVDGNPFVEFEEGYRIKCFDFFWKEGKSILLDGTPAGFYEKRNLTTSPPEQMTSSRPVSKVYSPPTVAVGAAAIPLPPSNGASSSNSPHLSPTSSQHASPFLVASGAGKARRKKNKRIVDLNAEGGQSSNGAPRDTSPTKASVSAERQATASVVASGSQTAQVDADIPPTPRPQPAFTDSAGIKKDRHRRSQSEFGYESVEQPSYSATRSSIDSGTKLRAAVRRSRAMASVFEAPGPNDSIAEEFKEADAFRARIEALRSDMGEGWLKVFSQSQLGRADVPSG
ncbi:hypothetical protein EVG20_g403 [Dentipellis fragilis]|uniref:Uncharacterized protein n=1 Tax=Dentipellis fragilis TaxID=205917 RepID=A0A4Y9ZGM7_9AGAM|nr:hypothetical protein EVG20_g403 [Dentipellis fragilis]